MSLAAAFCDVSQMQPQLLRSQDPRGHSKQNAANVQLWSGFREVSLEQIQPVCGLRSYTDSQFLMWLVFCFINSKCHGVEKRAISCCCYD